MPILIWTKAPCVMQLRRWLRRRDDSECNNQPKNLYLHKGIDILSYWELWALQLWIMSLLRNDICTPSQIHVRFSANCPQCNTVVNIWPSYPNGSGPEGTLICWKLILVLHPSLLPWHMLIPMLCGHLKVTAPSCPDVTEKLTEMVLLFQFVPFPQ